MLDAAGTSPSQCLVRLTFPLFPTGQRSGHKYSTGRSGSLRPLLRAFDDGAEPDFPMLRHETRFYLQTRAKRIRPLLGEQLEWRIYGAQPWYEREEIRLEAFPDPGGGGSAFVALTPTGSEATLSVPVEIQNLAAEPRTYRYFTNRSGKNIPDFRPGRQAGLVLVRSGGRRPTALPTEFVLAGGETLRGLLILETSWMPAGETSEGGLTVKRMDPGDAMNLQSASLEVVAHKSEQPVQPGNLTFDLNPSLRGASNDAPRFELRAYHEDGRPIADGADVAAGRRIRLRYEEVADDGIGTDVSFETLLPSGRTVLGSEVWYVPLTEGRQEILAKASDSHARTFRELVINVRAARPSSPQARIARPTAGSEFAAGRPVFFSGPVSGEHNHDPDGGTASSNYGLGIDELHWDFGDGHSAAGQYPEHSYEEPGEYVVTLRATDTEGESATDEVRLRIGPANRAPTARIRLLSKPSAMRAYALVGLTADASTDPDGELDIRLARWRLNGPEGVRSEGRPDIYARGDAHALVPADSGRHLLRGARNRGSLRCYFKHQSGNGHCSPAGPHPLEGRVAAGAPRRLFHWRTERDTIPAHGCLGAYRGWSLQRSIRQDWAHWQTRGSVSRLPISPSTTPHRHPTHRTQGSLRQLVVPGGRPRCCESSGCRAARTTSRFTSAAEHPANAIVFWSTGRLRRSRSPNLRLRRTSRRSCAFPFATTSQSSSARRRRRTRAQRRESLPSRLIWCPKGLRR